MAKYQVLQNFYASDKWINLRLLLINERGNYCEHCKRMIIKSVDIIGHHEIELTPENVHDHNISLNPFNIKLVCFDCHQIIHKRFGSYERNVYIIYGPPMGGKKTFVKQNMHRGDIVIDMDKLFSAVSMMPEYDKPDNLFNNVMAIHNALIDNIKTRYGKWHSAWIIGGYADKHKREKMSADLGAELIYCEASIEECLMRLEADEDRRYRKDEWAGYINKWFYSYVS